MAHSHVHIQEISLSVDEDHARVPIHWAALHHTTEWKALSFVRVKPTWIEPKLYPALSAHPLLASSLLLLKSPDWRTTLAIFPVGTLAANHDLIVDNTDSGAHVFGNARRVIPGKDEKVFVVCVSATGRAVEREVVKRAVEEGRRLVGGRPKVEDSSEFWDSLGICTYESYGGGSAPFRRPTKQLLLDLVPSFPIKHYLIDDGWQDVPGRKLFSFHEWAGMTAPMSEVVSALKDKGAHEVGVWVTMQGYWLGIHPDSPLKSRYDCKAHPVARWGQPRGGVNVPLKKGDGEQWFPSPEKAGQFWEDWFSEMKSWGITFVKCDNQADYDQITSPTAAHVQQAMWSGMLAAAEKVFGGTDRIIMCMSHNERMLNGPGGLDVDRPPGNLVFRNSDDFNLGYSEAHQDFILNNTYQTILTGHLSLIPDFDMFASNPPGHLPLYHALLRCLSPGPFLLSDTPDVETDQALLARMKGRDKSGEERAVKTTGAAMALSRRWFWDNLQGEKDGPALFARVNVPEAHGALIGAWNIRKTASGSWARDHLTKEDVEDALGVNELEGEYVAYSQGLSSGNKGRVEVFSAKDHRKMEIHLGKGECEGIILARVWDFGGKKLAVVGMLDKLAPLAGVQVEGVKDGQLVVKTKFACERLTVLHIGPRTDVSVSVSVDGQGARSVAVDELGEVVRAISVKVDGSAQVLGEKTGPPDGWELRIDVEAAQ
ncbi:hypothetical protein EHS25_009193 [Saitozyma podzolica]|uniref:Alpha-galactosidase n=1 Tax=Saitozyma podzolica TaxID=1890683 RepID=A0A427YL49_9TREE|nr:hypothetical protein EHS25_009193 [Saitozyma podzolica]